jgi:hypothetical protein
MTAWYDVKDTTKRGEEELFHIDDTKQYVLELIEKEVASGSFFLITYIIQPRNSHL